MAPAQNILGEARPDQIGAAALERLHDTQKVGDPIRAESTNHVLILGEENFLIQEIEK